MDKKVVNIDESKFKTSEIRVGRIRGATTLASDDRKILMKGRVMWRTTGEIDRVIIGDKLERDLGHSPEVSSKRERSVERKSCNKLTRNCYLRWRDPTVALAGP